MSPDEIREKIGLSDHDLRDFLAKYHAFVESLNEKQKQALHNSVASREEAARSLSNDPTPGELEEFLRARAPHPHATLGWIMTFGKKPPKL